MLVLKAMHALSPAQTEQTGLPILTVTVVSAGPAADGRPRIDLPIPAIGQGER